MLDLCNRLGIQHTIVNDNSNILYDKPKGSLRNKDKDKNGQKLLEKLEKRTRDRKYNPHPEKELGV